MRKKSYHKIADKISSIIAYAVILGPIIILIIVMACSYFGKIKSTIEDSPLHLSFEKKVYYTIDDDLYHESQDCQALQGSEHIYSAYKDELQNRTQCEQCAD